MNCLNTIFNSKKVDEDVKKELKDILMMLNLLNIEYRQIYLNDTSCYKIVFEIDDNEFAILLYHAYNNKHKIKEIYVKAITYDNFEEFECSSDTFKKNLTLPLKVLKLILQEI